METPPTSISTHSITLEHFRVRPRGPRVFIPLAGITETTLDGPGAETRLMITLGQVEELLGKFGAICDIELKPKGVLVEFDDEGDAKDAIEANAETRRVRWATLDDLGFEQLAAKVAVESAETVLSKSVFAPGRTVEQVRHNVEKFGPIFKIVARPEGTLVQFESAQAAGDAIAEWGPKVKTNPPLRWATLADITGAEGSGSGLSREPAIGALLGYLASEIARLRKEMDDRVAQIIALEKYEATVKKYMWSR